MQIKQGPFTDEMRKTVHDSFNEYFSYFGPNRTGEQVAFYFESDQDELISVVVVKISWGALIVPYAWTHKAHRKMGYATRLMESALDYANAHKCPFILVETMSDNACRFYQKLGFEVEFERKGYTHDVVGYYLRKKL
jgi:ribosomal protein S18 acetylase RimI-like enzyme